METKHKNYISNRPDYIKLVDLSQKNFETELDTRRHLSIHD